MSQENNRIARLFQQFADDFELLNVPLKHISGTKIGVNHDDKLVYVVYKFRNTADGYEYGAVIGKVDRQQLDNIALKVLTGPPMIGITERVIDGKFTILGVREGLRSYSDVEIKNCFMEDITRIKVYIRNYSHLWNI